MHMTSLSATRLQLERGSCSKRTIAASVDTRLHPEDLLLKPACDRLSCWTGVCCIM